MTGKLSGNVLWEGSRFIMPEHRKAWIEQQHEQNRRPRPTLDEQEWEQIGYQLQRSMEDRESVGLELFAPFERHEESGVVVDIDMHGRRVKLLQNDVSRWIKVEEIIEVL